MKQAIGKIRDARNNAQFVLAMMDRVHDHLVKAEPVDDPALCDNLMVTAGLENAMSTLQDSCIKFMNEGMKRLEGEVPHERKTD